MKHVQLRHLFTKELVTAKKLMIKKISTVNNVSDLLTKGLEAAVQDRHLKTLGITWQSKERDDEEPVSSGWELVEDE